MKKTILITILCVVLQVANLHAQQKFEANWVSIDSRPVPEWYTDAKFGIFIFWGLYSVPAWAPTTENRYAEWYWSQLESGNAKFTDFHNKVAREDFRYQDFVKDFTCEMFDPDSWATLFRESGARYVVLSSKHHDGYTLWPSAHSWNWNSVDLEPHRDLVGELSTAVKKQGLHMGYYFSLYEWFNPLYHNDLEKYVDNHMIPQMKDLINRYEPDLFYADGEWDHPSEKWKSTEFLAWLYNESPVKERVAVNDRWGNDSRVKREVKLLKC